VNPIDPGRRARPVFVKAATVITVTLLTFVVHAAWGYVETRRLDAAIQSIEARGEPVRTQSIKPVGDAATAARYYRAAAALASDFRTDARGWSGELTVAERTGNWPDALLAKMRTVIEPYEDMLSLVDRAAVLPFEDFGPGTEYNYLAAGLIDAIQITTLRAIVNAFDGDADAAIRSLYSAVRAGRWFRRTSLVPYSQWFHSAVAITLERVRAGDPDLDRLMRALADADDDDVLRQAFLRMRAGSLSQGPANPWFIGRNRAAPVFLVDRPWRTHQVNRQLTWYADVLDAIDAPWPDRIDAVGRIEYFNLDTPITRDYMLKSVEFMVRPLAFVRSLRNAVAIERYRRGHSEQNPASLADLIPSYLEVPLIDPFTGKPLLYETKRNGYVVYSAGVNRVDDNGDVSAQWSGGSDLGIAVRH